MTAPLSEIYAQVQAFVGDKSAGSLTKIKQWINEGVQDIWIAHDWPFKRATGRFNTVAPYSTGTISVTRGSTTVTISGGTFAGLEGYKLTSAIAAPFFRISSVADDGLTCTLESAWTEASLTDSTFLAYLDEYDLGSNVESIEAVTLLRDGYGGMPHLALERLESWYSTPQETGVPEWYYIAAGGVNTVVLGLSPVPDDTYAVDVRYMRRPTPMTADDDEPSLPAEFVPLIVAYAHAKAGLYDKSVTNAQLAWQEYRTGLATKISQLNARTSAEFRFKPHGSGRRRNLGPQPWGPWM